jgi:hypothetical protein
MSNAALSSDCLQESLFSSRWGWSSRNRSKANAPRFGNRAEGMFDIEWHVRLEIENDSEPQADLVGVVVRKNCPGSRLGW